ncbi:hypothetical protein HUO14_02695 [Parasphingorhabdus flavimaris]|uniref:Uncharacterized protein n=1 Tax=Parasphingorhabdus flavimaris TaxID=266812 RepID=A0ABX2MZC4_9SPHN|nr:hypothetical protein [Parasphingorhabdus flavimaris]
MPISRYDWLTVATDVFLLRHISVVDCALILFNTVFLLGLKEQQYLLSNLMKHGLPVHMATKGDLRTMTSRLKRPRCLMIRCIE